MAESRPRDGSPPSGDPLSIQDEGTKRARKLKEAHRDLKDFYRTRESRKGAQLRYSRSSIEFINLAIVERPQDKAKDDASSFLQATIHGIDQHCSGGSKKIEYGKLLDSVSGVSGKRVALIGAPGCGKTTLARKLCRDLYLQHLPNRYQLVLFVELRNLRFHLMRSKGNAEIGLPFILKVLDLREDLSAAIKEQRGQGVALILDGYDEIADDPNLSSWVSDLFSKESPYLHKCDMFVTTRPSQVRTLTDRLGVDVTLMEIIGFTIDNICSFIRTYFFRKAARANEVIKTLDRFPLVLGMCSNPSVLEIVCKLHQYVQEEPLPKTLSGMFMKLICHQLEEDLSLRQPPVRERIRNLLKVPENLFPGFYQLCEVAYKCCLEQRLILTEEDLGSVKQYVNDRGSICNLLFSEEVNSLSPVDGILYQCDHKTVQETLAAVHIGHLTPSEQEEIWKEWFQTPHMAMVWRLYCGVTKLKFLDWTTYYPVSKRVRDLVCNHKELVVTVNDKLLMLSLFETNNGVLASQVLSDVFSDSIAGEIIDQYDVAVVAHAISHHPHVKVRLDFFSQSLDTVCEPLHDCLKKVKSVELYHPPSETVLAVLSGTVEELRIVNYSTPAFAHSSPGAVESSHCLKSLHLDYFSSLDVSVWYTALACNKNITTISFKCHDCRYLQDVDCLKNVFGDRECVTLQLSLHPQDWRAVLVGLKDLAATSLKTLSLQFVPSKPKHTDNPYRITAEDKSFFCKLEEVIATLPQLVKVDVGIDPFEMSVSRYLCFESFLKATVLSILQGAVRNMDITNLSLQCQGMNIPELLPVLSSSASAHITNVCLECHTDVKRISSCLKNWIDLILAGPMTRPTCLLRLPMTPSDCGLLLSKVANAEHLQDLTLVTSYSDCGISDSCLNLQAVEKSIANCGLRKLHIELENGRISHDYNNPNWCQLLGAVLRGLASNPNQMDFMLFGKSLDAKKIIGQLPPLIQCKFEIEELQLSKTSFLKGFSFIFSCRAGPSASKRPASTSQQVSGPLSPSVKAPRYFNSSDFMKKYSSFPNKVKAKSIALKLRNSEAIGDDLLHNIKQTYEEKAGQLLYQELLGRGTPSQIRTVCKAMRDEEGNPQMNQLGRNMLDDEDLLLPPA